MKHSASTYMTAPLAGGDTLATLSTMRSEAAKRLGGEDGLMPVSLHLLDDGTVAATWRREWETEEPKIATADDRPDPAARTFAEDV
jgi:hypothetical protein